MLVPAVRYKDILLKKFSEVIYDDNYALYCGWPYCNDLPDIKPRECNWQWAIIDKNKNSEEESVIGYLAYQLETLSDRVCQFGLYSFDRGNIIVGKDVFDKLEELTKNHHSVEWRMISTNPAKRSYDRFCKKHNGNICCLHDIGKDRYGHYFDEYIYEIVNNEC